MMRKVLVLCALATASAFYTAQHGGSEPLKTIVGVAVDAKIFNTLVAAVTATDLVETLNSAGPFTVLAPNDDAFNKLAPGTVEYLLTPEGLPALKSILLYHVVPGRFDAATVVTLDSAPTVEGRPIAISVVDGKVMLNGDTMVIGTDIAASNGLIHMIDHVLMPPAPAEPLKTIVGTAVEAGIFNTLVAAVTATDLVDTLNSAGPFTVLAPNDDAFKKLAPGTVEFLLTADGLPTLKTILLYHVVPGRFDAATVQTLESAPTVNGAPIAISVVDGNVMLNGDTMVIGTDIAASNGLIHMINRVLIPPSGAQPVVTP